MGGGGAEVGAGGAECCRVGETGEGGGGAGGDDAGRERGRGSYNSLTPGACHAHLT